MQGRAPILGPRRRYLNPVLTSEFRRKKVKTNVKNGILVKEGLTEDYTLE